MSPLQSYRYRDLTVRYFEHGQGTPMIWLHNAGTSHAIWQKQLEVFSRTHRVIAFDLPGSGQSDRPDVPYDVHLFAGLLEDFIRDQKIDRPILVGNCVGAGACLEYSLRHPSVPRALILFNVYGGSTMIPILKLVEWGLLPPSWGAKILGRISVAHFMWGSKPPADDPVYRNYLDVILRHPLIPFSRKNTIRGAQSFNKFARPIAKPAGFPPTLLFWGERNKVLPLRCGRGLRDRLAPECYLEIAGAGHLAMSEAPELVNAEIQRFLAQK